MTDPISFTSASARFSLPYLFPGQTQKEFFVNQAHALVDGLLHPVVEGTAATPPAAPLAGQQWLVGPAASGVWTGQSGRIATFETAGWTFAPAIDGMRVFDRAAGQEARYLQGTWQRAVRPAATTGGTIIDSQARAAISQLIDALATAGIIPVT